jgi:hypothetical protein
MTGKTSRVFAAWTALTENERDEVIALINKYQKAKPEDKKAISLEHLNESHRSFVKSSTTMNFGPTPGTCPSCGR